MTSSSNIRALLLVLLPTLLGAATYYASPSGNDSNPGTSASPFRTVARGIQTAGAGDTIVLKDGTYPADTPYGGGSTTGLLLYINKSGAPGAPITLKAEHKQMAVLDCGNVDNAPKTGCDGYINMASPAPAYWVFQDLRFTRAFESGMNFNGAAAHDITVKGCLFDHIGRHIATDVYGKDGVYANRSQYNLTFDGNAFTTIGRLPGSANMSLDHGLYLHSTNSTIVNNVFYGPEDGFGVQTAAGFSGLIADNTFAETMTTNSGQLMLWDVDGAVVVRNNIFYNPPGGIGINSYGFSSPSCVVDHNMVYGGTIGSVSGCAFSNNTVANPAFVNAIGNNFHLQLGSPAIDAGVTVSGAATDYDGVARGAQGKSFDVGAFEYPSVQPPVISAVAATNVTSTAATITWTTNKTADSQAQYGLNGYTVMSAVNPTMVTQHTVLLTNLTPSTTYHYSVLSRDSSGYQTTSADFSCTTAAPQPPPPTASTFAISASASSISTTPGQPATDTITATLLTGTPHTVAISVTGLPAGVTAALSPASCAATCSSTLTVSPSTGAAAGTYALTVSGTSGAATVSTHVTLTIADPLQGAAGLWAFNDGAGTSTVDLSPNGNTGTLMGHTAWVTGTFGTALSYSGSGDYVQINESRSLELTTAMTVTFWVKASDSPGVDQRIVSKNYDWDVKLNGNSHSPQFSSGSMYAALNYTLPMGAWQHVAFTFSQGTVKGYINGVQTGFASNTFTAGYVLPAYQYGLYFGTDASKTYFAKGVIDSVRIYNRALTAAEVSTMYSQTKH